MKFLKKILLGLLILIFLLIVISFFLSRQVNVQKQISINAPVEYVFGLVNNPSKWKKWSVWDQLDTNVKDHYEGPKSGIGAIHRWESEDPRLGNGKMIISESVPGKLIEIDFLFMENDTAHGLWTFSSGEGKTLVTSEFSAELPPIIGPYLRLMMLGDVETNTMKSLENLKRLVERLPAKPAINISRTTIKQSIPIITITDSFPVTKADSGIGALFGELVQFIHENGLQQIGAPIGVWRKLDQGANSAVFTGGIPVSGSVGRPGRIKMDSIPAGNVVTANHFGPYKNINNTYEKMRNWLRENKLNTQGIPWEVYITDPGMEPDTSKWQTAIFFRVE